MKTIFINFIIIIINSKIIFAQCSLCTKTAQQLGPQASKGMNAGVLYMIFIVLIIISYIIYRLKKNKTI